MTLSFLWSNRHKKHHCLTNNNVIMNTREEIIRHAKTKYLSSPHEFTEEELDTIIESGCKCDHCGKSIFDLNDFPEIRDGEVFCEDCYSVEHRTICPICEEEYEKDDKTDYFFITKSTTMDARLPIGLYKALKRPFFYGDCVTGFEGFFDGAVEQVNDLNIDEFVSIKLSRLNNDEEEIETDMICPDCAKLFTQYENLMKALPHYLILHPKYDAETRAKYAPVTLRRLRQRQVNINITLRGMLERANNPKFKKH